MCHALIIEDEPLIALHIADLAEEAGATTVIFAETQVTAIDAALEHKPDIILSDVQLLEGTGPAAVTAIRDALGVLPVIFITATPEAVLGLDMEAAVLVKPLTVLTSSGNLPDWRQIADKVDDPARQL